LASSATTSVDFALKATKDTLATRPLLQEKRNKKLPEQNVTQLFLQGESQQ